MKYGMWVRATYAGVGLAGTATGVLGQTINDGNSSFVMPETASTGAANRTGTQGGAGSNFIAGGSTSDHLFQQWWWYRVNGVNVREFALSNRTSNVASGNTLTLTYVEPEGLNVTVAYRLTDGPDSPATANVSANVTLTNTTAAPMDLSFFAYLDYDLAGSAADTATLIGPGRMQINDTTGVFGQFLGEGANAYGVAAFATLRTLLTDADLDDFVNTGLPFASGDFTGGFQWNLVLPAGGNRTIRTAFSINTTAVLAPGGGPTCDGIDFNNDGLFPDTLDVEDFISVFQGGACSSGNCNDIDFNNDGLFPDTLDVEALISVFQGGPCL